VTNEKSTNIFSVHGVRYQVTDVARAVAFYVDHGLIRYAREAIDLAPCRLRGA
jgi:hypothetical protein